MNAPFAPLHQLAGVDPRQLPVLPSAVVVLGGGVAGLRAALEAAAFGRVLVVTKDEPLRSASAWAQGGVAAAVDADDTPAQHAADTLAAGGGLSHPDLVDTVVRDAPERIAELVDWGARFDLVAGRLAVGREGGHRANRIVHAGGDATGAEIMRVLMTRAADHSNIELLQRCFALDLLLDDHGAVCGVLVARPESGFAVVSARTTILATGGCACLYPRATPPPIATGDGLAMALRAGAALRDLEMIQFHPTVLALDGPERRLISEAVRGEGARLLTRDGRRFMPEYDPRAELAPRDIVARAVFREMRRAGVPHVYLDVRHLSPGRFAARFPAIDGVLRACGVAPEHDLIPVRPAAHYSMGGVVADRDARTTVAGLLACGEAASSGLHGANRLASNSLLEALVFGRRAGFAAGEADAPHRVNQASAAVSQATRHRAIEGAREPSAPSDRASEPTWRAALQLRGELQQHMWDEVGIEREADGLRAARRWLAERVADSQQWRASDPTVWETQNMLLLALATTMSAELRTESRGAHYRRDFPSPDPHWLAHTRVYAAADGLVLEREPFAPASAAAGPPRASSQPVVGDPPRAPHGDAPAAPAPVHPAHTQGSA